MYKLSDITELPDDYIATSLEKIIDDNILYHGVIESDFEDEIKIHFTRCDTEHFIKVSLNTGGELEVQLDEFLEEDFGDNCRQIQFEVKQWIIANLYKQYINNNEFIK